MRQDIYIKKEDLEKWLLIKKAGLVPELIQKMIQEAEV